MKMSFFTFKLFMTWIKVNWYFLGGGLIFYLEASPMLLHLIYVFKNKKKKPTHPTIILLNYGTISRTWWIQNNVLR
jgi:hypothetical protein